MSRIDKFKDLVAHSHSKHLSSISSHNIWNTYGSNRMSGGEPKTVMVSESFSNMTHILRPTRKPQYKQLEEVNEFVDAVREKLRIDNTQKTWMLLPKLKMYENYGIRAAVYDFIYMVSFQDQHNDL